MYVLIPFLRPLFLPGSRIPGAASGCPPDPQHLLRFRSSAQRREGGDLGLSWLGRRHHFTARSCHIYKFSHRWVLFDPDVRGVSF